MSNIYFDPISYIVVSGTKARASAFNNVINAIEDGFDSVEVAMNLKASLISPALVTPNLGTPSAGTLTNCIGLPLATGITGLGANVAAFLATPSSANLIAAITDETGTGSLVFSNSPILVTPNLGTPSALVGTNITGIAAGLTAGTVTTNANLTGHITSVGNAAVLGSFSSAQLSTALTDKTGSGIAVFATGPALVAPALGTPISGVLTNCTDLPIPLFWGIKNLRLIQAKVGDATRVQVNPDAENIALNIGAHYHVMTAAVDVDAVDNLDTGTLAAGTDYFVYACTDGATLSFKVSANSTNPTGFDAAHSRKIGGFHTLCVAVGAIGGHTLTNFAVKDILPATVWCLKHRAKNLNQVGQLWNSSNNRWEDIYLSSNDGTGGVQSVYNAAILDTTDWNDFVDRGGKVGKQLFSDGQFQIAAAGSNEETNITGSADPGTTGGHVNTAGRRMISNLGHEDMCGVVWQWLQDQSSMQSADAAGWYDLPGSKGQLYRPVNTNDVKLLAGGGWYNAAICGSRSRDANNVRWAAAAHFGSRFVAEPL